MQELFLYANRLSSGITIISCMPEHTKPCIGLLYLALLGICGIFGSIKTMASGTNKHL